MNLNISNNGYVKLQEIDTDAAVKLLEVFLNQKKYLSRSFIEYDTTYVSHDGQKRKYEVGTEKVLVLLFMDRNGRVFTDTRPYSADRLKYYSRSKGREFKVHLPTV